MATPIKRIEKDFLLKVLFDEQIPIMYFRNRTQYILMVERPTKGEIYLKSDRVIPGLKTKKRMDLMFDYRGQVITFFVQIIALRDDHIITEVPDFLYKNLDRSYSRVVTPPDLQVQMLFLGDRYSLTYPKISEYAPEENLGELLEKLGPEDLSGLIAQLGAWAKDYASGHRMTLFKDVKPASMEEHILAETGKILYLPKIMAGLPQEDRYPKKQLITKDLFHRYLESIGVEPVFWEDAENKFLKEKAEGGFRSEVWVPILFHEYVIGYIYVWVNQEGMALFNNETVDTLQQFAKVLAFSLKINGFFDAGKMKNEPFEGRIVDISVSGLLFAYPRSSLSAALVPGAELKIRLNTPNRSINARINIIRCYRDAALGYFGCRFLDMLPEDIRFLFEYIYGKPFTDEDAFFLTGRV
jgi:hypothetical protein